MPEEVLNSLLAHTRVQLHQSAGDSLHGLCARDPILEGGSPQVCPLQMEAQQTILILHPHLCTSYMLKYTVIPLYNVAATYPWREPARLTSFVCIAQRHGLLWCCQIHRAGRHHCGCCCRCDHLVLGSLVLIGRVANYICRESGLLQRALIVLLPFFAVLTGTVYSGASLYLCPSVCVHLHHLLVLWV